MYRDGDGSHCMNKKEIRSLIIRKRKEQTQEEILAGTEKILRRLCALPQYLDAAVIYSFVGCKGEVATTLLIEKALKDGKKVAVPKCLGDVMEFFYIKSLSELKPGTMGIPEPEPVEENKADVPDALMILPGLAFSPDGGRVGFGGGYYDKFLASHPELVKVAVAFSWQIMKSVPTDEHDMPVPVIVTDEDIIYA